MKDFVIEHISPPTLRVARCLSSSFAVATTLLGLACGTAGTVDEHGPLSSGAGAEHSSGAAGAAPDHAGERSWCEVQRVLQAKCQRCHAASPEHGAPFPLVSYEDTQVVSAGGTARFSAIEKAVLDDFMPPGFIALEPPVLPLSDAEKQTLLDWCASGAPAGPEPGCDPAL
jgi:uncharacterized membrane protein